MILVPKSLSGVVKLVAVDLRGQRVDERLRIIDAYVAFARKHRLVDRDQETELVEMLVSGARFEDAVAELRAAS
ncbi:MAG: hypothetical protein QOJ35_988 [Solirubrobacteraceae bacterium]|jgi:hypothetical protein|nr:hypothetical protein [Solirubrobacteraceae bacterium]